MSWAWVGSGQCSQDLWSPSNESLGLPLLRDRDRWIRFIEFGQVSWTCSLRDGDPWARFTESGEVPWTSLIKVWETFRLGSLNLNMSIRLYSLKVTLGLNSLNLDKSLGPILIKGWVTLG